MTSPFLRKQELKNRELTPGNEKVNVILYVLLNTQCLQLPGSLGPQQAQPEIHPFYPFTIPSASLSAYLMIQKLNF